MDIVQKKSSKDLLQSLLAEAAKCKNEISCAQNDIKKARGRLDFVLVLVNELINRKEDQK